MPYSTPELSPTITTPLRCLVVDDDPMSVQIVRTCIGNTPFLAAAAACGSAIEAAEMLRTQEFDVLFLDVEMPIMSGLDLLRSLPNPPQVVLITSSRSYAVQAFEFAVADYLLKPLSYPRFLQAAQKVLETITTQRTAPSEFDGLVPASSAEFTFVKVDNKLVRVDFADVFYVEALGDYVHLVTSRSKLIVYSTMRAIEEKFPPQRFVRVHRSFIINIDYVQALEDNSLLLKEKYIPIGQTYMRGLLQRLNKL
ncbi:LytR/AlgR family response regulator transcription factor [Hymenobacter cheonanensis]|uniref:LytR/AlgR family response regulator transcription factor n=1 Tax=Hymenobacter sp. CA2-7 TaxID=3063993 RepID=UPI0027131040|nr:LytTR family DNA-binding domain-containing protein [Hymenobacter sp. CA2-7]MDO7885212.1 LytTR family DNA-binding domain-containing protein [Hymenobacter sp. CA2-7]